MFAKYGPAFTLPFSEFKRRRDALVERVAATFGAGDHGRGVFAPGEDLSLIGRAVGRMPSAPPVDAQAELDDPRVLAAVDTKARFCLSTSPAASPGWVRRSGSRSR